MTDANIELGDIHWLMDILQNIDVGLVVLDRDYNIQLWNGFMESHSGLSPHRKPAVKICLNCSVKFARDWFMKKSRAGFSAENPHLHYLGATALFIPLQKLPPDYRPCVRDVSEHQHYSAGIHRPQRQPYLCDYL